MDILDSDILVAFLRGQENAVHKVNQISQESVGTTSLNVHEVIRGAWWHSNREVDDALMLFQRIRILLYTFFDSQMSGELFASLVRKGPEVDDFDVIIAAIALNHNAVVVPNNKKHFERIPGLSVEGF